MTSRPSVVVADDVNPDLVRRLATRFNTVYRPCPPRAELLDLVAKADALVVRSGVRVDREVVAAGSRLRVVVRAGSGTDNIAVDATRDAGITVVSFPALSAVAVAELTLALALGSQRRVAYLHRHLCAGRALKTEGLTSELAGRTAGVVGIGAIGSIVARLLSGMGMSVLATARSRPTSRRIQLAGYGVELVDLDELLVRSDVVSLHVPATLETEKLIDARALGLMKRTAILVNTARASIVDERALCAALLAGKLGGAGLDVFEPSSIDCLASLPGVVMTPHVGAMTSEAQERIAAVVFETLVDLFDDEVAPCDPDEAGRTPR